MIDPKPGDEVAIYDCRRHGDDFVTLAKIERVTPSGQIVANGRRFKKSDHLEGREFYEVASYSRNKAHFPVQQSDRDALSRQERISDAMRAKDVVFSAAPRFMTEKEIAMLCGLADLIRKRSAK